MEDQSALAVTRKSKAGNLLVPELRVFFQSIHDLQDVELLRLGRDPLHEFPSVFLLFRLVCVFGFLLLLRLVLLPPILALLNCVG